MLNCNSCCLHHLKKVLPNVTSLSFIRQSSFNATAYSLQQKSLVVQNKVNEALCSGKPVVALESTIVTHGMPYPNNFKTAIEVENIIKENAALPATVGVIDGKIHVGMDEDMLKYLATCENACKLSRRDISVAIANKLSGGTTVSATMLIANWAGIKVFVTGGIGGVHKMGENTMDISTDLRELGQTSVMVISAGIKSILDIGKTLEYLETEGVTVATFGETKEFPAFFTPSSGYSSPYNIKTPQEVAKLLKIHTNLELQNGMLLAVPIPQVFSNISGTINEAITTAFEEAKRLQVSGKEVTPFMLQRVNDLTGGLSLEANILLIKNNAKVGAQVAKCYSDLVRSSSYTRCFEKNSPVVIGGCNFDVVSKSNRELETGGASNPATVDQCHGGVGRNITEALMRLSSKPFLVSAVGRDPYGKEILKRLNGLDLSAVAQIEDANTGLYNVVLQPDGEMFVGVSDSRVHSFISCDHVMKQEDRLKNASLVCVDGNIPTSTMSYVCSVCSRHNIPILYEPTEVLTSGISYMAKHPHNDAITYMTPSIAELGVIFKAVTGNSPPPGYDCSQSGYEEDFFKAISLMCKELQRFTPNILVTLGKLGVLSCTYDENGSSVITHYNLSSPPSWTWLDEPIVNVMGAGDSFAAGFIIGLLRNNGNIDVAVRIGITAAQRTLRTHRSVSEDISEADLNINPSDWKGFDMTKIC